MMATFIVYNTTQIHTLSANAQTQPTHRPSQKQTPRLDQKSALDELVQHAPPRRPAGLASALLVDHVPVELAAAGVDVNVREPLPGGALPDPADEVEEQHDEEGEVGLEEALSRKGCDGSVELGGVVSAKFWRAG